MKRVQADVGVGAVVPYRIEDPLGGVGGDQFDLGASLWADFGEELAEDGLAAPFGDPQQLTGVVVDHDGEEFEAPPVGDLVHAYTA